MTDKVTSIQKIQQMEHILNRQQQWLAAMEELVNEGKEQVIAAKSLFSYYGSKEWHEQLEQDAKGQLPEDLYRGVLSEDGIYNSLVDYREMAEDLAQLSQQMLDAVFTERNG